MRVWTFTTLHGGSVWLAGHDGGKVRLEWNISVRNVGTVVWRIKIYAIPASREGNGGANSAFAEVVRETGGIISTYAWRGLVVTPGIFDEASVAKTPRFSFCATQCWFACQHTKALRLLSTGCPLYSIVSLFWTIIQISRRGDNTRCREFITLTGLKAVTFVTASYGGI